MDVLRDPCNDRQVKSVPAPPQGKLTSTLIFPNGKNKPPDYKILKDHLKKEGRLYKEDI